MDNFIPDGSGLSPLARVAEFVNVSCPKCFDRLTPERRASLEERGRQIKLAAARGEKHIGSR